jgi:meso-butanediol dehydrogenase/(S,S)-butanediol dehydrogenase/diacetyl reductase
VSGRLEGRVVLISGTAGGQGRAAARLFAAEGARVVGCDIAADLAAETVELVRGDGGQMISVTTDVSDAAGAGRWVEAALAEWGRVDVLYNNASIARFGPVPDFSAEDWSFVMRNELDIVMVGSQAAWPHLAAADGCIVNIASASGLVGSKKLPAGAHAAAKAGVIGLTRQLAAEGVEAGIRANSITPGLVETPASAELIALGPAGPLGDLLAQTPLGVGRPEDIAFGALYLCSEEARWVTGTNLVIDGGRVAIR